MLLPLLQNNLLSGGITPVVVPQSSSICCGNATTAQEIILGALKRINSYSSGESLSSSDAEDALETLNDLLDSFSTDDASVYASNENVFQFVSNQYVYTIGNYCAGTFAGVVSSGSVTVTMASVPSNMVINGDIAGIGIPPGTTILGFTTNTVTMSQAATITPGAQQISYTICGDFKMNRPLRIQNSFTRINTSGTSGLDYPIEVVDQNQYTQIGYKGISAPWPIAVWYNPTNPLGTLYFYQNPSGSGELHLFTDTILTNLCDLTDPVSLPKGYSRWLKWALAKELAPEYGKSWTQSMQSNWKEARDYVMSLNKNPTPVSNYDQFLTQPRYDAGWILYGGFR